MNQETISFQVKKFNKMLNIFPDDPKHAYDFINFIRVLIRIKSTKEKPTTEVMTIIKNEKPKIFYAIRKYSQNDVSLGFAVELEMDYLKAKEQIKRHIL